MPKQDYLSIFKLPELTFDLDTDNRNGCPRPLTSGAAYGRLKVKSCSGEIVGTAVWCPLTLDVRLC